VRTAVGAVQSGGRKMPFIRIVAYEGKEREKQVKAAEAVMAAAAEALGAPQSAFTVMYEDFPKDEWQAKVAEVEIEPKQDKIIIKSGELV
jgi:phenylpyruvate tautomerase PptA (4-oxalocrotonate tautomerase family)